MSGEQRVLLLLLGYFQQHGCYEVYHCPPQVKAFVFFWCLHKMRQLCMKGWFIPIKGPVCVCVHVMTG